MCCEGLSHSHGGRVRVGDDEGLSGFLVSFVGSHVIFFLFCKGSVFKF